MKIKITFFDLETTSGNPVLAEILTGFFCTLMIDLKEGTYVVIDELSVNCKPLKFDHSSTKIHGITKADASTFGDKRLGLRKICEFFRTHSDGFFCCHANAFIFGRHGHFDWTVIKNDLVNISQDAYNWFNTFFRAARVISTHTIAKKLLGRIDDGLSLENLASFYGLGDYNKHNAQADTQTLIKIFMKLIDKMDISSESDLYDLGHYSGTIQWTRNGFLI